MRIKQKLWSLTLDLFKTVACKLQLSHLTCDQKSCTNYDNVQAFTGALDDEARYYS